MKTFVVLTGVAVFSIFSSAYADNRMKISTASYENFEAVPAMEITAALAPVAEANLEVESWMTNESFFAPLNVVETEQPMEVESWMTNPENFMETSYTLESDQAQEVESWMIDQEYFAPLTFAEEAEKALEVQGWMLDQHTWGR